MIFHTELMLVIKSKTLDAAAFGCLKFEDAMNSGKYDLFNRKKCDILQSAFETNEYLKTH